MEPRPPVPQEEAMEQNKPIPARAPLHALAAGIVITFGMQAWRKRWTLKSAGRSPHLQAQVQTVAQLCPPLHVAPA
eukprot:13468752-Alexandrium_andersonii.AAC.1